MKATSEAVRLDEFFARVRRSGRPVLLLDYDGTLAPFRAERDEAVPYAGVRELLESILDEGHSRVVVISGRSVKDLAPLLATEPLPELWGAHGWERRLPDGSVERGEMSERARDGLEEARERCRRAGVSAARLEEKPGCLALHWRGDGERERRRIEELVRPLWRDVAQSHDLGLHDFDGGIELRIPGRTKEDAVNSVLEADEPDVPVAYLGDDLTDEDAFRALEGRGLSVLVRTERRDTRADVWLRPPQELLEFLRRWREAASQGGASA